MGPESKEGVYVTTSIKRKRTKSRTNSEKSEYLKVQGGDTEESDSCSPKKNPSLEHVLFLLTP